VGERASGIYTLTAARDDNFGQRDLNPRRCRLRFTCRARASITTTSLLGNVIATTDSFGAVAYVTESYQPFGARLVE